MLQTAATKRKKMKCLRRSPALYVPRLKLTAAIAITCSAIGYVHYSACNLPLVLAARLLLALKEKLGHFSVGLGWTDRDVNVN